MDVEGDISVDNSYIIYITMAIIIILLLVWIVIVLFVKSTSVLIAIGQPELHTPQVIDVAI